MCIYLSSSFWFTHLGNYLPDEPDWYPYTYAKWWNLRETMNNGRINAFMNEMLRHQVGTYAYFNVTEYGGSGASPDGVLPRPIACFQKSPMPSSGMPRATPSPLGKGPWP